MCGIYGIASLSQKPVSDDALLERMARVIIHRGPDDQGDYRDVGIGFGMRRLSIIDLQGGHQPIPNEDQTIWAVCNGEIYNFKALRADLEAKGHRFRCNSDTEVIVHLYEERGLDFVKQLRGMFALALWDKARQRLVLARDRLGKKPLYIRREPDRFMFASEIKSILQVEGVPRRLDFQALQEYLALGYVPAPRTLFEGIEKVLPGHYLMIEKGQIRDREYWDIESGADENCSEPE